MGGEMRGGEGEGMGWGEEGERKEVNREEG